MGSLVKTGKVSGAIKLRQGPDSGAQSEYGAIKALLARVNVTPLY